MEIMICVKKERFAVCQLSSLPDLYKIPGFSTVTASGNEISLVCEQKAVPETATNVSDNWVMLQVMGKLDFSLVGIIAEITEALAERKVPVCCISTFDTDYFLVKAVHLEKAIDALVTAGFPVVQ